MGFKISARALQRSVTLNTLWACFKFFWANHWTKILCFCVHSGAPDLIYPGTSLYERIVWMHLEKNRTYACTFAVQRKEINVVKVRFTMRYSSKNLNNKKAITTAQLATFKNKLLALSSLWVETFYYKAKKYLKSLRLFKPGQGIWTKTFTHAHYVFPLWNLVFFPE